MDLINFAKEHIRLFHPTREEYELFDCEIEVLNHISYNTWSSITKSRSVGMSGVYAIYIAWLCFRKPFEIHSVMVIDTCGSIKRYLDRFLNYERYSLMTCYGTPINFITTNPSTIRRICGSRSNVIIIDDVPEFKKCTKILNEVGPLVREISGHEHRFSISFTPFEFDWGMLQNYVFTENYVFHYSKTPLWPMRRLEKHSIAIPTKYWASEMDCEYVPDYEEYNKEIVLTPFKTKYVLKIEDEILKQIKDYD